MRQQAKWMLMSVCALPLVGLWPAPANAQQKMEVKAKAPMYSYIANWEQRPDGKAPGRWLPDWLRQ